jgi:hypothetical protein
MRTWIKSCLVPVLGLISVLLISMAIRPEPVHAAGTCGLLADQVVINEILPAPSSGPEWVELYNKTDSPLDISNCYIDDKAGEGKDPFQIPVGNTIPAHGFLAFDFTSYFNNDGDDVRLLLDDASTILDSHTYGATGDDLSWYRNPDGEAWAASATSSPTIGSTNNPGSDVCGSGTWQHDTLEIHHFDVGQGDATLIVSPTGKSLLFDTSESDIGQEIEDILGCKQLDYLVISHFHEDHIGSVNQHVGLWNLVEERGFTVGKTLLRDYNKYMGRPSAVFDTWKGYFESSEGQAKLHPDWADEEIDQVDLGGGVTFDIMTVDGNKQLLEGDFSTKPTPPSENDYSIGALISIGAFDEWLGGDLDGQFFSAGNYAYHDIETSVAYDVGDVDVLRVHHHGSDHSSNATFLRQLDPEVSIISVGNNTFGHPTATVVNRLVTIFEEHPDEKSDVYLTERGNLNPSDPHVIVVNGDVVVRTANGSDYTVSGTSYTATEPVRIDADDDGYFAEVDPNDNDPSLKPFPNGGCDSNFQTCPPEICTLSAGQVWINEILPAPSSGKEWVELYNTTGGPLHAGYCFLDDIAGDGGDPVQILAGSMIKAHGLLTLDFPSYFNNSGDDVRLLLEDATTILDSFTFVSTGHDLSWYRSPNGGPWAATPTSYTTKGSSNTPVLVSPADAIKVSSLQPIFDWEDMTAATGYTIQVSRNAAFTQLVVTGNPVTSTYTPATALPVNATLFWRVQAKKGSITSGWSKVWSFSTANPPGAPVLLSPANNSTITGYTPTLKWRSGSLPAGTTLDHYRIQIASDAAFSTPATDATIVTAEYTLSNELLPGATYYWRVMACNSLDEGSAWSSAWNFKTSATVFDNGVWWIKKVAAGAGDTMDVYVNNVYWGKTGLLQFGHSKTRGDYPEAAALYDDGYVRLVPLGLPYGTSFILGPAHWDSEGHDFHNLIISGVSINTASARPSGPLLITITARDIYSLDSPDNNHFDITHQITFPDPSALITSMAVTQTWTAKTDFSLSSTRQALHEGFKWAQFSSMYIDNDQHDSDAVQYRDSSEGTQPQGLAEAGCGAPIFSSPLSLDAYNPWLQLRHGDSAGWQGNTPNTAIRLADKNLAGQVVPQGYITCSSNPNDDNVGLWLNDESAPASFLTGQTGSMRYTLIARDNPLLLTPALVLPADTGHTLSLRSTFDWNDVTDAGNYFIQVSKNAAFTQILASSNASNSTYVPARDLPRNMTLYWRVKANGAADSSDWSRVFSFTSPNPPVAPVLLLPASNALTTDYTPRLDWAASTLPNGTTFHYYELWLDDNATFSTPYMADIAGLVNHEVTIPDLNTLAPNTPWYWRVRSYNTDGEYSAWSLVRYFRTAILPPTLQAPDDGFDLLYNRPIFDWDDVPGATGYTIKISRNSGFTSLVGTYLVVPSSYTPVANLPANVTLYWRVQSRGANGPSGWSATRTVNTANPPGVPALLLPASNALTTDYTPRLDWGLVTLPLGTTFGHYQVQVADNAAFITPVIDVGAGVLTDRLVHEYTPGTDLNPNTKYYWRVRSYNTDGEYSAWSLVRTFRTALSAPVLSTPNDGETITLLRPPFGWLDVPGATSYTIQVSKNSTFTSLVVTKTVVPSTFTPLANLPANVLLYWRVRANGLNGPSSWSAPTWSFTVVP